MAANKSKNWVFSILILCFFNAKMPPLGQIKLYRDSLLLRERGLLKVGALKRIQVRKMARREDVREEGVRGRQ